MPPQCSKCGASVARSDASCPLCGHLLIKDRLGQKGPNPDTEALSGPFPITSASNGQEGRKLSRKLVFISLGIALPILFFAVYAILYLSNAPRIEQSPGKARPGTILYQQGFNAPADEWPSSATNEYETGWVKGGEYRVVISESQTIVWRPLFDHSDPTRLRFDDFVVEVDARQVGGPPASYGLAVRLQTDEENFYWFSIDSDGYYAVDLVQTDDWTILAEPYYSAALYQEPEATNHLKVVCEGDRLSFYANDILLIRLTDDTYRSGYLGLAIGTFEEPGAVIHFDNFQVSELGEQDSGP